MGRLPSPALLLLSTASLSTVLVGADPARPRGVGPEFAKYYKDSATFTCISNPTVSISAAQVNDDYCDCPDGSDEPGTAACSHLTGENTSLSLPGFYCKNKGHIPGYIPFTNINDGICDYEQCCDGSDEWEGVGGIKCEDKCKEIGKEWRKQDESRKKSLGVANKRRKELVAEAAKLQREVVDRISTLTTQLTAQELKVADLEKELNEVERREKGRVVKGAGKSGKVTVLAGLAKERIGELKDALGRVRGERDSMKARVAELEAILTTFKEEYNPNFNDEGVKRTVKKWEDYAARDKGSEGDAAHDRDVDEMLKPDEENGIKWEEYEGSNDNDDVEVLYQFEEYLPKPLRDWVDQKLRDLRLIMIENGILAAPSNDGNESKAVSDARGRLSSAQNDLERDRRELQSHKDDVDKDYGPEGVFRALKGQCIEKESGEYTYEFCWMDKTTQKPMKGGGNTGMGNFVRVEKITVDEELPPDGKGLGSGERYALKFENGQHCWNGPSRSTTVILACAEKDEIWKIVEEEKCVYRMEVGTAAVCDSGNGKAATGSKDEL